MLGTGACWGGGSAGGPVARAGALLVALLGRLVATAPAMDLFVFAEHALVAAVVLGEADPAQLIERVRESDFGDPTAGLLFETCRGVPPSRLATLGQDLPALLRARGVLRGDGYPMRELLDWLPELPVPAHPQPWAAMVVTGSLQRVVQQAGARLAQVSDGGAGVAVWAGRRPRAAPAAELAGRGGLHRPGM